MNYREKKRKFRFKEIILTVLVILAVAAAVVGIGGAVRYLEWEKPQIVLEPGLEVIGKDKVMNIRCLDRKSGLRRVTVELSQGGASHTLASLDVPAKGLADKTLRVEVKPQELGLREGEAQLTITATDFSPLKNTVKRQIKTTVDAVPPRIALLSLAHNVNPGGTCLAVFKVSKKVAANGVRCGNDFFPAYAVAHRNKTVYLCYFAVPMDVTPSTVMQIVAQDRGGNTAVSQIPFYIRSQQGFRSDTVKLGGNFLDAKAAEFSEHDRRMAGKTPEEIFAFANTTVRNEISQRLMQLSQKSAPRQLWSGTFLRMQNAAPMAKFGDRRTYTFNDQPIGESVHMGVDLASTTHAPIEAANAGTVVFADYLGIYGNAVAIDHGMGVTSLYGHMNEIAVKPGQALQKGTVIGTTGSTGLAGGDHLHFSVLVGGRFVNPIEWWDPHWIKDNVEKKLTEALQGA